MTKRIISALALLCALSVPAFAQFGDRNAFRIRSGTTPPASCLSGGSVTDVFVDRDAASGQQWMVCEGGTFVAQGSGTTLPVADTQTVVKGSADATKLVRLEADGLTTGTTRVVTVPDANTTLPVFSQAVTFSGPTAARTVTLPDANFTVARTDAAQTFAGAQTFSNELRAADGSASAPAFSFSGQTNTGFWRNSSNIVGAVAGSDVINFNTSQFRVASGVGFGFTTSPTGANNDTGLHRESAGLLAVTDGATASNYRDIKARHLLGGGSAPTCAVGGATVAGTGATCSVTGTDFGGEVTINTGTGTSAAGTLVTVTFAAAYGNAPYVTLTPSNFASSQLIPSDGVGYFVTTATTNFAISDSGTIAASSTYKFHFVAVGR